MTRLYLVRHGETEWNRNSRTQGSTDTLLTPRGIWQAERVAERLEKENVTALYSSDLKRAYYTAKAIGDRLQFVVKTSPDFREMNLGNWEGKTLEEIKQEFNEIFSAWRTKPHETVIPGGEDLIRVQERALKGVSGLIKKHPGEKIVLVSHGITIKALVFGLLDIDLIYFRKIRMDNGSVSMIDFKNDGNVLVTLNDTYHLKDEYTGEV